MNYKIINYGYSIAKDKVSITFSNGDKILVDIRDYIRQGQKLPLISTSSLRKITFTHTIVIVLDIHIGFLIQKEGFSRVQYKKDLETIRKFIRENVYKFENSFECMQQAFSKVDLDIRMVRKYIMTNDEYQELIDYTSRIHKRMRMKGR